MKSTPSLSTWKWQLPSSTTLGSSVRAKGIERELRRRLPWPMRKHLSVEAGHVILAVPDPQDLHTLASRIGDAIEGIAELPLLPSEVEDVLAISSRERHKWLEDGRLQSAGTRTVTLRGRARAVTFHIFDPRHIETILDGDLPAIWREEDAIRSAENRRRAAAKAVRARNRKNTSEPSATTSEMTDEEPPSLAGWDDFEADGLLR
ncbi:hypothetical protein ASE63_05710 [Bosea sp. Root381]|uniref:hypothetical protein n=1 Tax=Bosea sp. Root381 TaxID=1736524 RepID=UPI0006FA6809|nr:hypothetical protein [Bosea sp. Root381]KRE05817.1 hypothetical protein ASE63_05710 [Bosea sp. Root381]